MSPKARHETMNFTSEKENLNLNQLTPFDHNKSLISNEIDLTKTSQTNKLLE